MALGPGALAPIELVLRLEFGWFSQGSRAGSGPELRSSRSGVESESAFLTKADAAGQGTSSENRGPRENALDVHRLVLGS